MGNYSEISEIHDNDVQYWDAVRDYEEDQKTDEDRFSDEQDYYLKERR